MWFQRTEIKICFFGSHRKNPTVTSFNDSWDEINSVPWNRTISPVCNIGAISEKVKVGNGEFELNNLWSLKCFKVIIFLFQVQQSRIKLHVNGLKKRSSEVKFEAVKFKYKVNSKKWTQLFIVVMNNYLQQHTDEGMWRHHTKFSLLLVWFFFWRQFKRRCQSDLATVFDELWFLL